MIAVKKNNIEKKQLFSISNVSAEKMDFCSGEYPEQGEVIQLMWFSAGYSRFRNAAGDTCTIGPGEMLVTKQHSLHIGAMSDDVAGFSIVFNEAFLFAGEDGYCSLDHARISRLCIEKEGIKLMAGFLKEMTATAGLMVQEQASSLPYKDVVLRRYLRILLIQATRNLGDELNLGLQGRYHQIVEQYLELVEKGFREYKMVSDYASQMNISSNHLNSVIKKVTGHSASAHIRHRIIKEAQKSAAVTGSCMKMVAYDLGFSDAAHFSKYFKATCGVNFTTFKRDGLSSEAFDRILHSH